MTREKADGFLLERIKTFAPAGTLLFAYVYLTLLSWRKSGDPLIDFGRELYTPWRLSQGAVLQRDVATLFGPFSLYWNALLFRLFGASMETLWIANLVLLGLLTIFLFDLFRRLSQPWPAALVALSFLVLAGFPQFLPLANYNFLTPYSHEITHGLALSIFLIWNFVCDARQPRVAHDILSGAALGLIFLTKPEMFVATAPVGALGFWLTSVRHRCQTAGQRFTRCVVLIMSMVGVILLFLLCLQQPLALALQTLTGGWRQIGRVDPAAQTFYLTVAGLHAPFSNSARLLLVTLGSVALLAAGLGVDRWVTGRSGQPARLGILCGMLVWGSGLAIGGALFWLPIASGLPIFTGVILLGSLRRLWRQRPHISVATLGLTLWATLASLLLLKVILQPHLFHYGFALVVPAFVLLIAVLLHTIPAGLQHRWQGGAFFKAYCITLLLCLLGSHLQVSRAHYQQRTYPLGHGSDQLFVLPPAQDARTAAVQQTLAFVSAHVRPEQTVAVFPEGVMLNFLARRRTSIPYITLMPPEMRAYGEGRILSALQTHPPDFILLSSRDMQEYGVPPFGRSPRYGKSIADWIRSAYYSITVYPQPQRSTPDAFTIEVLQRLAP